METFLFTIPPRCEPVNPLIHRLISGTGVKYSANETKVGTTYEVEFHYTEQSKKFKKDLEHHFQSLYMIGPDKSELIPIRTKQKYRW